MVRLELIINNIEKVMQESRTIGTVDSPAQHWRYIFSNHLQSATLELEQNADIISYEEYYPFGGTSYYASNASINAVAKRYKYSGKEKDEETGLYYFGARYQAPWLCRFISVDPKAIEYIHQSSFVFADNNPVMLIDVNGEGGVPTVRSNTNGEDYIEIKIDIYLYSDDPNVDMSEFVERFSSEVNALMNPSGNDPNNLEGLPNQILDTTDGPKKLPVIFKVNAIEIKATSEKNSIEVAQELANSKLNDKSVNVFYVTDLFTKGRREIGEGISFALGGNSGYIDPNVNPNIWVHEILHMLDYFNKEQGSGKHNEIDDSIIDELGISDKAIINLLNSLMTDGAVNEDKLKKELPITEVTPALIAKAKNKSNRTVLNKLSQFDVSRINNLKPLNNKTVFGCTAKNYIYSKMSLVQVGTILNGALRPINNNRTSIYEY